MFYKSLGVSSTVPFSQAMTGRIDYLRDLLSPKGMDSLFYKSSDISIICFRCTILRV